MGDLDLLGRKGLLLLLRDDGISGLGRWSTGLFVVTDLWGSGLLILGDAFFGIRDDRSFQGGGCGSIQPVPGAVCSRESGGLLLILGRRSLLEATLTLRRGCAFVVSTPYRPLDGADWTTKWPFVVPALSEFIFCEIPLVRFSAVAKWCVDEPYPTMKT